MYGLLINRVTFFLRLRDRVVSSSEQIDENEDPCLHGKQAFPLTSGFALGFTTATSSNVQARFFRPRKHGPHAGD